ncbi:MAG: uridine kinase [Candidatus Hydrogenedentes bacterium]|nr:uridine kinase [Candidatus Hydrogenedentota bacterium]
MDRSPCLVAIAGASCAGKTSIAAALTAALPPDSCSVLAMDSYYRDLSHLPEPERATVNFDHPDAWEWPLLRSHLMSLTNGRAVQVPEYDFTHHARTGRCTRLEARPYLVLEGLFALRDQSIRSRCTVCAFVDTTEKTAFERRVTRDARERGRTPQSVVAQFGSHVLPMYDLHILPTRQHATIILDGADPPEQSALRILECLPKLPSAP